VKLCVVFNPKGQIVAASRLDVRTRGPLPRPIASGKLRSLELDVPVEHRGQDVPTICKNFRVDAKRKTLIAITPKKTTAKRTTRSRS
jgi:hypothetical protein